MTDIILENLARIEQDHTVRILYAVESGSRAWGFASQDSDYDVRFIYIHPLEWYLSISDKRDVIECPISGDLDICGWELRKALGLFRKSKPPLLEWLGSPITYIDRYGFADKLRGLVDAGFSPRNCMHHYLHSARNNLKRYLSGDTVKLKKYFYSLRPVLACLWIERHNTMPPTEFSRLYADAGLPAELVAVIDALMTRKIAGIEKDQEPRIPLLHQFVVEQLQHYLEIADELPIVTLPVEPLDNLFRDTLKTVWADA